MRIYLASRFYRRAEMQNVAISLEREGHEVTSRWILSNDIEADIERGAGRLAQLADEDLEDVRRAEVIVLFGETEKAAFSGGRFVEFGYALALGKIAYLVGSAENIFAYWYGVNRVRDVEELISALAHLEAAQNV
jgi:nucleoside 2-deoxyribosyltransferase